MATKFSVTAPGKVILHGEHSVVYGRKAIACSIGARVSVDATTSENLDSVMIIDMPSIHLSKIRLNCSDLSNKVEKCENFEDFIHRIQEYCKTTIEGEKMTDFMLLGLSCILYAYYETFHPNGCIKKHHGIFISIHSEIPIGAGLGSSAAFNTSIACVFLILSGKISLPKKLDYTTIEDQSDTEKISSLSFKLEKIVHKTPSGIDNSIAAFGGAVSFHNGLVKRFDKMPILQLLIVDTKITRSTKALVNDVKNYFNAHPNVVSPILDAMNAISVEAENLIQDLYGNNHISDSLTKWGKLIVTNQNLLSSIGVSHCELDKICAIAQKHGCPAKLTGAGGGGCAIVFLDFLKEGDEAVELLENDLVSEGYHCMKANLGGPGVLVKSLV